MGKSVVTADIISETEVPIIRFIVGAISKEDI